MSSHTSAGSGNAGGGADNNDDDEDYVPLPSDLSPPQSPNSEGDGSGSVKVTRRRAARKRKQPDTSADDLAMFELQHRERSSSGGGGIGDIDEDDDGVDNMSGTPKKKRKGRDGSAKSRTRDEMIDDMFGKYFNNELPWLDDVEGEKLFGEVDMLDLETNSMLHTTSHSALEIPVLSASSGGGDDSNSELPTASANQPVEEEDRYDEEAAGDDDDDDDDGDEEENLQDQDSSDDDDDDDDGDNDENVGSDEEIELNNSDAESEQSNASSIELGIEPKMEPEYEEPESESNTKAAAIAKQKDYWTRTLEEAREKLAQRQQKQQQHQQQDDAMELDEQPAEHTTTVTSVFGFDCAPRAMYATGSGVASSDAVAAASGASGDGQENEDDLYGEGNDPVRDLVEQQQQGQQQDDGNVTPTSNKAAQRPKRKTAAERRAEKEAEEARVRVELTKVAGETTWDVLRDEDTIPFTGSDPVEDSAQTSDSANRTEEIRRTVMRAPVMPPPLAPASVVASTSPAASASSAASSSSNNVNIIHRTPLPRTLVRQGTAPTQPNRSQQQQQQQQPAAAAPTRPQGPPGKPGFRMINNNDMLFLRSVQAAEQYERFQAHGGINPQSINHLVNVDKVVRVPVQHPAYVDKILNKKRRFAQDGVYPGVTVCLICIYGTYDERDQNRCQSKVAEFFDLYHNLQSQCTPEINWKMLADNWNRELFESFQRINIKNSARVTPSDVEHHFSGGCIGNSNVVAELDAQLDKLRDYIQFNEQMGMFESHTHKGRTTGIRTINRSVMRDNVSMLREIRHTMAMRTIHTRYQQHMLSNGRGATTIAPYLPITGLSSAMKASMQASDESAGKRNSKRGTNLS